MRYYEKKTGLELPKHRYPISYYYSFRWVKSLYNTIKRKILILKYGFDTSDTWSLDYSLAQWIYPRLIHFKETAQTYPSEFTSEEWSDLLGEMIDGIKLYLEVTWSDNTCTYKEEQDVYLAYKHSMQLITDNLSSLWD